MSACTCPIRDTPTGRRRDLNPTCPQHGTRPDPKPDHLPISDLRCIHLNPGDRLAAITPPTLTRAQHDSIREDLTAAFPDTTILIYTSDLELVALGPGQDPQHAADGTTTAAPDNDNNGIPLERGG